MSGCPVAGQVRPALRVVEALAAALGAEAPVGDEPLHPAGHVEAFLAVGLEQVLGDVQDGVQPEQVDQPVGADREDPRAGEAVVDQLDRQALLLLLAPDLRATRVEDAVDDEAGDLLADDRLLADRLRERERRRDRFGGGVLAFDDLDQRHQRGGVEVVEADHLLGAQRGFADLRDRQRGGVGGEDRVPRRERVELREDALLDLQALGHRLDHEVDLAEAGVGGGALDAREQQLALRGGLLGGDPPLLGETLQPGRGDPARPPPARPPRAPRRCPSAAPRIPPRRSSGRSARPSSRRPRPRP